LPADKNNNKKINSTFLTLVKPFASDLAREGSFLEIMANLDSLHYNYEVTRFRDHIGYISLLCNDDMKIHISPKLNEKREEVLMTTWHEYTETARDFFAARNQGIAGYYSFEADFELIHNEWDPEADEDSPRFIDHGDAVIGSVESSSRDFQEFIERAVLNLSVINDIEVYPKRIPLKREIA
jgi:hypothetical protein